MPAVDPRACRDSIAEVAPGAAPRLRPRQRSARAATTASCAWPGRSPISRAARRSRAEHRARGPRTARSHPAARWGRTRHERRNRPPVTPACAARWLLARLAGRLEITGAGDARYARCWRSRTTSCCRASAGSEASAIAMEMAAVDPDRERARALVAGIVPVVPARRRLPVAAAGRPVRAGCAAPGRGGRERP